MQFTRASKKQSRLRLGFVGPSGSGKTFSAIKVARELVGPNGRIAVIDTEHGSAAKYAGEFDFDVLELETFAPTTYVDAIHAAEDAGYDVVVIDSLTHAWTGKEGALEQVDNAAARNRGNSYVAWRDVTPQHNALIDAMVGSKIHVIATMRAKTEYVLEDDGKGKKVPRKIGMAPVQRDGMEYEFDVVGDLDQDHKFIVTKTRCAALDNKVILKPGRELAETLRNWLTDGVEEPAVSAQIAARQTAPVEPSPADAPISGRQLDAAREFVQMVAAENNTTEDGVLATWNVDLIAVAAELTQYQERYEQKKRARTSAPEAVQA